MPVHKGHSLGNKQEELELNVWLQNHNIFGMTDAVADRTEGAGSLGGLGMEEGARSA